MRIYDPRLGKFFSMDPIAREFAWNSPYAFAENDVIRCIDMEGLEKVIIFGGADVNSTGLTETMKEMQRNIQKFSNDKKLGYTVKTYNTEPLAGFAAPVAIVEAYKYIKDNYTKGEPIIIYGYSMGGVAAAQLSKLLKKDGIKVNLMITIDPAFGYIAKLNDLTITIPDNVKTEVNIYQTENSSIGSSGTPAKPQPGNETTNIINIPYDKLKSGKGSESHSLMDEDTKDLSEGMIKSEMLKSEGNDKPK